MNINVLSGVIHEVTDDIIVALNSDIELLAKWNSLTEIQRNEWICWIISVKKTETRKEHIKRMMQDLNEGKRKPCCWPGCPHRNPASKKWFKKLEE